MNAYKNFKIESKNDLNEIDIKIRACYYLDDIITSTDINISDNLLDKRLQENVSVYNISCKNSTVPPRPLGIRFDKINGFIVVLGGNIKHLVLFDYGMFDKICDKVKYLINKKYYKQYES